MNQPNTIVEKKQLSDDVFRFKVLSPLIAESCRPGQFIILQISDNGERIPLTIADSNATQGLITLIFQTVGKTTHLLAELSEGETILNLVGPLGKPTHVEKVGTVVCVGGGIGVAPLYPIAKAMKTAGNELIVIIGARNRQLIILEEEMRAIADELIVCTDDGSYGEKALVTAPLKRLCENTKKPDLAIAIGPPIMMKFCAETTRPYQVPTVVSLNTIMIDGTGMCGGCRVTVGGKTQFVCVDGPEFDGHLVDFNNMMQRLKSYKQHEHNAHEQCHL
ncbi:MAG TPA: sulfide/dihydroorotate dehydrogenase-like FAD/NAD-binding protein, partial [Candidatus Omnitrophota bacterium]|nr:sulfide/dihydroorotate dehydrogenase-like FAD/NAD-binding protein [Candidatus Omnitrophota bacterium]